MTVFSVVVQGAHLWGLCAALYRGQGVGRALLAELLERANRDTSLEQILLSVGSGQCAAMKLYSSFGLNDTDGAEGFEGEVYLR
jgi:ribosomal protein S18 acetylase RimI-like enzyme